MQMAGQDCLTRLRPVVDPRVEPLGIMTRLQRRTTLHEKIHHRGTFITRKREERVDVTARNDQRMARRNRVAISESDGM